VTTQAGWARRVLIHSGLVCSYRHLSSEGEGGGVTRHSPTRILMRGRRLHDC
jgi:hypothetical protein